MGFGVRKIGSGCVLRLGPRGVNDDFPKVCDDMALSSCIDPEVFPCLGHSSLSRGLCRL